jgi:hypothetical protein
VHVTVIGSLARIAVTPTNAAVLVNGTQQFTATAMDALGTLLSPQPAFIWSVSGGGTVNASGLLTAGTVAGGLFTVVASSAGVKGSAWVTVNPNLTNLAPAGTGYTWYSLTTPTANSPRATASGINDGNLGTDVYLLPGSGKTETANVYEAAGVVWSKNQTIGSVMYKSGSFDAASNGVFDAGFKLQFSLNGSTWNDAGPTWTMTPAYLYDSPLSANTTFTFSGNATNVQGVRCVGRVHTGVAGASSWVAAAKEVQAFAPAPVIPVISVQLTNPVDNATYTAPATVVLAATASINVGKIATVEFFNGVAKLGQASAAPYTLTWRRVPVGVYTLTARASDSAGNTAISTAVRLNVVSSLVRSQLTPAMQASKLDLTIGTISNGIVLTWPASWTNVVLEAVFELSPSVPWGPVTNLPQAEGDQQSVTIVPTGAQQFFRLRQQ